VATDGGSSFDSVLQDVLPGVQHILCLFHILENVKRNCKPALGKRYTDMAKAFSELVENMRYQQQFDQQWQKLLTDYSEVEEYLSGWLYPRRHHWCNLWTKMYTTFGARSTQRSESTNRVIKYFIDRNTTLEHLFKVIMEISEAWEEANAKRLSAHRLTNHSVHSPVYLDAVKVLTREAASRLHTEWQYVLEYNVLRFQSPPAGCSASLYTPSAARVNYVPHPSLNHDIVISLSSTTRDSFIPQSSSRRADVVQESYHPHTSHDLPDEGDVYCVRHRNPGPASVTHWVRVREGSASCTDCPLFTNWLLPCRHVLAVNRVRWPVDRVFRAGQCHCRWKLSPTSLPVTLPSTTSTIVPVGGGSVEPESMLALVNAEVSSRGLSKDAIYRLWTPAAERLCGFIQQHGQPGLLYSLSVLDQLVKDLCAGGKGVPRMYYVTRIRSRTCAVFVPQSC
jgi:hypothetical protein